MLEIMVSLALLSGVIITILGSLNYHLSIIERDRDMTIATMLAREKLEEMKTGGILQDKEGDFAPKFENFRWKYDAEDTQISGLKKVYLSVSWGRDERITLETYETKK
ncbi:MAG: type II secretion system protein GspI [Deltaproteobacteria bacterium]|nr:type II secretion system protein GspI [Deltaproteobacteria bacterium]